MILLLSLACRFDPYETGTTTTPTDSSTPTDSLPTVTESDPTTPTDSDTTPTESDPGDSDSDTTTPVGDPPLIVVITQDAFTRYYYGWYPDGVAQRNGWDTTPYTDSLVKTGVIVPEMVMARPLTGVSLATFMTGAYPRNHRVRDNADEVIQLPTIQQQFQAAGWTTALILSNRCIYADEAYAPGWDHAVCTYEDKTGGDQQEAEDLDVELFKQYIDDYAGGPLFLWVHLINPHDELETVEPWYSEFHPEPYTGGFNALYRSSLDAVSKGDEVYGEADRLYVDATYASAVRANDARIEEMMTYLQAAKRFEDAVIVLGADHGDELAMREDNPYFWHGCTYYNVAGLTSWFFKAPSLPAGSLPGHPSATDIAPTLLELGGVTPDRMVLDGTSLVPDLEALTDPGRPAFMERGTRAVGVVDGGYKYFLNPDESFFQCSTYSREEPYVTPAVELYDLTVDPLELVNLAELDPTRAASMRGTLCDYVLSDTWSASTDEPDDEANSVYQACLADGGS